MANIDNLGHGLHDATPCDCLFPPPSDLQKQLDNAMTQLDRTTQTCLKNQLANEKSFARIDDKMYPPPPIITVGEETTTDEQQTPASPLESKDVLTSRPTSPMTNGQTNDNGAN